jgi:GTPase
LPLETVERGKKRNLFIDTAKIYVKAGDGGNGIIAFQHEAYVPFGGPSGGDGGHGGSVIFRADKNLRTLIDFKYKTRFIGKRGMHGEGDNRTGKSGEDTYVVVPPGTIVKDAETGEPLFELINDKQEIVVARGGKGGKGNARFATPTNQAPRYSEPGTPGKELTIVLELKLLADVGLVGFPNAGKSTILSRVSAARPKIADYPFTTLEPNLGVVNLGEGVSFVLVDIPGLIEGAHEGRGLGHEFLRHIERTRVLIHVIDMAGVEGRDPVEDYQVISDELRLHNPVLITRPLIIAANKMDLPGSQDNLDRLKATLPAGTEVYAISAVTGAGVTELMYAAARKLEL